MADACSKGSAGGFLPAQETLGAQLVETEVALSVAICAASAAAAPSPPLLPPPLPPPPPPPAAAAFSSSSSSSSSACSCRRRMRRRILTASAAGICTLALANQTNRAPVAVQAQQPRQPHTKLPGTQRYRGGHSLQHADTAAYEAPRAAPGGAPRTLASTLRVASGC